jgi:hypothetical protein
MAKALPAGIRERLGEDLEAEYETIKAALKDAMETTKQSWAWCPNCSEKVKADFPDNNARIKAIELWFSQGLGRVGASGSTGGSSQVAAARSVEALDAMPDDALAAYAWAAMSAEEREAELALIEQLSLQEWPKGFGEALERLHRILIPLAA